MNQKRKYLRHRQMLLNEQQDDKIKVNKEYKKFIEEVYKTYSDGNWKQDNLRTPIFNYVNSIPFDIWCNDYLKKYSSNKDLPEPFNSPNGEAWPYIVTVDKASKQVLSIRRNWNDGDSRYIKREHFVSYKFVFRYYA